MEKLYSLIFRGLITTGVSVLFSGCGHLHTTQNPLFGEWENITQGNRVALKIIDSSQCQLTVERTFKAASTRACKYEAFSKGYLVFLVKEDGLCGSDADFEFHFDAESPLIEFYVDRTPIVMQKAGKD